MAHNQLIAASRAPRAFHVVRGSCLAPVCVLLVALAGGCETFDEGGEYTYTVPVSGPSPEHAVPIDLNATSAPTYSTARPTHIPYDPFLAAGGVISSQPVPATSSAAPAATRQAANLDQPIRLNPVQPPKNQASSAATNLYGELMASAADGRANGQSERAGGANYTQLSFASEGADFDPCVTPDGERIVFASTQHQPTADLYVKSITGRVLTQLTSDMGNDVMPRVSPDGERIAFASNRNGNWDIFVMPIAGGRPIQVTTSMSDELSPSWSPDGQQLVYSRMGEVSGQWELWVADVFAAGSNNFIGFGLFPQWSPVAGTGVEGADRIAFQRSRERGDRYFGIWTLDYKEGQASNSTELVSFANAACINPSWSPDGRWIAYATVANPGDWARATASRPTASDLWLMDVNANTRIRLTNAEALSLMPTWAPNQTLVFVSDRSGVDNIWSMSLKGAIQLASSGASKAPVQGALAEASSTQGTKAGTKSGKQPAKSTKTASAPKASKPKAQPKAEPVEEAEGHEAEMATAEEGAGEDH